MATSFRTSPSTDSDGGTRIETYFADGSLKSVTGSAAFPVRYEYGVEGGGAYTKEIKLDAAGSDTSEWTKTYLDMLGRSYKTVYSDGASSQSYFNSKGQLWKQVDPDLVATLFAYNAKGEREYTVVDLDRDDTIDYAGPDRITRVQRTVLAGTPNVVRLDTSVWKDGQSSGSIVSRSETSTDGNQSWQTVWREAGNDATKAITQTTSALPDRVNRTRTVTLTAPGGTQVVTSYKDGRVSSVTRKDNTGGHSTVTSTTYGYEEHGRQSSATDARNGTTAYTFNNADQITATTAPDAGSGSQVTTASYDNIGRVTGTQNPDGTTTTNLYFPTGLLKRTSGSRVYPVENEYDGQGRMRTNRTWQNFSAGTGSAITRWNYDPYRGWLKSKDYADPASGLPPASPQFEGTAGPVYEHTAAGRLSSRTWLRNVAGQSYKLVTTYGYEAAGDLQTVTYNDNNATPSVTYIYDRLGRRSQVVRNGITTTLAYDDANEPLSESYAGGTLGGFSVSSTYNNSLQRASMSLGGISGTYSVSYGYDVAGRLSTVTEGGSVATYGYVANSMLSGQITLAQSGTTRMTTTKNYDKLNRLTSVSSMPSGASAPSLPLSYAYIYNQANQRVRATLADGSYWIYAYDQLGQAVSGDRFWPDGTRVAGQQFEYSFDDIGNRKKIQAAEDAAGALLSATYTSDRLNRYSQRDVLTYLAVVGLANPTAAVTVNGNTASRRGEYFDYAFGLGPATYGAWWRSLTVSSTYPPGASQSGNVFVAKTPETYVHDADGNLTSDGRWNYTWDGENRLVKIESLGDAPAGSKRRLEFAYDYMGRRIWAKVTNLDTSSVISEQRFLYDGWNLVAAIDPSTTAVLRSFVWGTDVSGSMQGAGGVGGLLRVNDTANGIHFVAYDGNGNVAGLVSSTDGSVSARYEYGPFGENIRTTGTMAKINPFRFSTKFQDDEGDLLYYGYRYYNPSTGRWLSRDPVGETGFRLVENGEQPFLASELQEEREQENRRGLNDYAFVLNDPLEYIDPDGRASRRWQLPEAPKLPIGPLKIKPVLVYVWYDDLGCPDWWACIIIPPPDPKDKVLIHPRDQVRFSKCMATARQIWNDAGTQPWSPPNVSLLNRGCRYAGKCYKRFW